MKKYFFNDGTTQQGPFTLEELTAKNINAQTPVWYDGLPDWTTAGQLEELKDILVHTPPPFHVVTSQPVENVKPETPTAVKETPATAATKMAASAPGRTKKKSTAWLSYVLSLLVLGGVGYLVYQDMEKNKGNTNGTTQLPVVTDSISTNENPVLSTEHTGVTTNSAEDNEETKDSTETTAPVTTVITVSKENAPPSNTTKNEKTSVVPVTTKPTNNNLTKTQQAEAQKLALKKAEEEKKKLQAAQAAAAKEMEYRNNWPKYITIGNLDYGKGNDGVDAFNVPVYNGTNAMLDKVTVRVDYMKKEKKVLSSEIVTIYNIPPGGGLNGNAIGSKKGNNVKVFITGITSRKLHFCFPSNNGNPSDPYFCN